MVRATLPSNASGPIVNTTCKSPLSSLTTHRRDLEFTAIAGSGTVAAAITTKGELYTWGESEAGVLGHFDPAGKPITPILKPTRISTLNDFMVKWVSLSKTHMLVLGSSKQNPAELSVFGFGRNTCGQIGNQKEAKMSKGQLPRGKELYCVAAGDNFSLLLYKETMGSWYQTTKCVVSGKALKRDAMFLRRTAGGVEHYSPEVVQQGQCPRLLMVFSHPIREPTVESLPLLQDTMLTKTMARYICGKCKRGIAKPLYLPCVFEAADGPLCQLCFERVAGLFTPCVYYRINEEGSTLGTLLPSYSLAEFYKSSGAKLELKLRYSTKGRLSDLEGMSAMNRTQVQALLSKMLQFDESHDEALLKLLDERCKKGNNSLRAKNKYEIDFVSVPKADFA